MPDWANGGAGDYGPVTNIATIKNYSYLTAKRYLPMGVTHYQIGNEINLPHPGWGTPNGATYVTKFLAPQAEGVRQAATERPFTSSLDKEKRAGIFACAGCGLPLFSSKTKFNSGTGWPSFYKPLLKAVATRTDYEIGYPRTEVHCRRCGGHLGHVFDDGPPPTGKRYCMNGVALSFMPGTA